MSSLGFRLCLGLGAAAMVIGLPGCVDTSGTTVKVNGSVTTDVSVSSHHSEASPRGATVSFASLDGPPPAVATRFAQALAIAAGDREIGVADAKTAHYIVRGYLTARSVGDETEVAYVWDVFDAGHHRAQRVTDAVTIKGVADDPWSLADDKVLAQVAGRSAEDLANFLATRPEAARAGTRETAAADMLPGAGAMSYAAE